MQPRGPAPSSSRPTARFRLPDGTEAELGPGDIIGRLASAALSLDDPSVSEAHAMVSLRGDELKLLALRGRFTLGSEPLAELALAPGQRIWLTRDLLIDVLSVQRPDEVLAIEADGMPPQVPAGVCVLFTKPGPRLVGRFEEGAAATLWSNGGEWRLRIGSGPARSFAAGDRFSIDGIEFRAVAVGLRRAEQHATFGGGAIDGPLRIEALWDVVHLHRAGLPALTITGQQAKILSELAAIDAPVAWESIARSVWPTDDERGSLRRKWDVQIARLRANLRQVRVRADLVCADGSGNFELRRYPGDVVENRS